MSMIVLCRASHYHHSVLLLPAGAGQVLLSLSLSKRCGTSYSAHSKISTLAECAGALLHGALLHGALLRGGCRMGPYYTGRCCMEPCCMEPSCTRGYRMGPCYTGPITSDCYRDLAMGL